MSLDSSNTTTIWVAEHLLLLRCRLSLQTLALHPHRYLPTLEILSSLNGRTVAGNSLTAAYCAVALHCLAHAIRAHRADEFIRRIRARVSALEGSENGAMCKEGLGLLRRVLDAVSVDRNVGAILLERDTLGESVEAIRVYCRDAEEEIGPSFLEIAAAIVIKNGIELRVEQCRMDEELVPLSHKSVNKHIESEAASGKGYCLQHGGSTCSDTILWTPEIERLFGTLKLSSANIHMAVDDPHPDAVKAAIELVNLRARVSMHIEKEGIQETANAQFCGAGKVKELDSALETKEVSREMDSHCLNLEPTNVKQLLQGDAKQVDWKGMANCVAGSDGALCAYASASAKQGLMDWTATPIAIDEQWDDPIESSSEISSTSLKNLLLSMPKRKTISPLKIEDNMRTDKRRKIKRWNTLEEDTLRNAVARHGKGRWKFIRLCYLSIFGERTEGDLKDKSRNLTSLAQLLLNIHNPFKNLFRRVNRSWLLQNL